MNLFSKMVKNIELALAVIPLPDSYMALGQVPQPLCVYSSVKGLL
jgi:hypothetical protein